MKTDSRENELNKMAFAGQDLKTDSPRLTDKEIDKELMEAGCLCPDYTVHIFGKLSDWQDGVRYMTCEKCGKITAAMALTK